MYSMYVCIYVCNKPHWKELDWRGIEYTIFISPEFGFISHKHLRIHTVNTYIHACIHTYSCMYWFTKRIAKMLLTYYLFLFCILFAKDVNERGVPFVTYTSTHIQCTWIRRHTYIHIYIYTRKQVVLLLVFFVKKGFAIIFL